MDSKAHTEKLSKIKYPIKRIILSKNIAKHYPSIMFKSEKSTFTEDANNPLEQLQEIIDGINE